MKPPALSARAIRLSDQKLVRAIVTPEGIPIRFTLARAGDRAGAFVLDVILQMVVLLVIVVVASLAIGAKGDDSWLTPIVMLLAFFLTNFYFAFFEVRWQGATPGKRRVGIRVIDARGGQLETSAVLARNLVRELEVWTPLRFLLASRVVWPGAPGWAIVLAGAWTFVFLFVPLFNKDRLRVGDLIAGTRVVMHPKVVLVPDLVAEIAAASAPVPRAAQAVAFARAPLPPYTFTEAQLTIYGIYELQVLEDLLRGNAWDAGHETAIHTVADKIRAKTRFELPVPTDDDERFLRDFYAALRAHLEQKMLFGKRREDKFSK